MSSIHDTVILSPWRAEWVHEFHLEKQCIIGAMIANDHSAWVYHVGSTSVEGMVSKPIIDILVCPDEDIPLLDVAADLEQIGYTNLGECGRPGRFFLVSGNKPNKTFYVHLCYKNNSVAQDQLLFQQIERTNKTVAANYMALKLRLAEAFSEDRNMYRTLKGLYIQSILYVWRSNNHQEEDKAKTEV